MITRREKKAEVMNRLVEKTFKTIKEEGIVSLAKKTTNYIKFKTIYKDKNSYGDILFINGCVLPHPQRYRVDHQVEQLLASGLHTDRINDGDLTLDKIKYYRGFVFYRCPISPNIEEFINKAKEENKTVFYDIDDLVIDRKYTDTVEFLKTLSKEEKKLYDDGVERMQKTLKICDYAITTTDRLAKELKNYVSDVYINRNVASERMVELSQEAITNKEEHDDIVIGYLSGSITHNPDVEMIKPALINVMKNYDNVKLKLVGDILLPEEFEEFRQRIIIEPFVDWEKLPNIIASLDINLAPLEDSIFNEAKSENKWMEAAHVKTVTLASNIGAFKQVITNDVDGVLFNDCKDFENKLVKLIEDKNYRESIANNAYKRVIKEYVTTYSGHGLAKFIREKLHPNIGFVLPTTNLSGGVNVIIRHMKMLRKHGYDVTVINMDNNNDDIITNNETIRVLKEHKTTYNGHFDTLVASLWTTLDFVKKYSNVTNKKYLVQGFETDFGKFGQFMRVQANSTYEDDTNVEYITISKWCKNWLNEKYEKNAKYAPNGIDLSLFKFKKRDFKGKIKILVEGNSADYYKNVDESFKIVDKLDKDKYEIQFLSYQGEPKKWYYVDKFLHKVPYEEVYKIYQGADILIKSSILESFSYPPLEMMATGGLVVVAPNEGNIEFIKDEENCLFYEPGNIDSAVKQIERLRNDKKLRDKLIKGGLATAKKRDWKTIEKEVVSLYENKKHKQ